MIILSHSHCSISICSFNIGSNPIISSVTTRFWCYCRHLGSDDYNEYWWPSLQCCPHSCLLDPSGISKVPSRNFNSHDLTSQVSSPAGIFYLSEWHCHPETQSVKLEIWGSLWFPLPSRLLISYGALCLPIRTPHHHHLVKCPSISLSWTTAGGSDAALPVFRITVLLPQSPQ